MALNVYFFDPDTPENAVPVFDPDADPYALDGTEDRMSPILFQALMDANVHTIQSLSELQGLQDKRVMFALPLNDVGMNKAYSALLARLRREPHLLDGCTAGMVIDGSTELYTKSVAAEMALAINMAGGALVGRPLVEATGSLSGFAAQAKAQSCSLEEVYLQAVQDLARRMMEAPFPKQEKPEVLVLRASDRGVSSTMALWDEVEKRLDGCCAVTQLSLDLAHGALMQEEVCSAVCKADAVVLLCPNHNDALPADLSAFIDQLAALSPQTSFRDKAVFAIVASGYSGSDIVARQVIAGMNLNQAFFLPGHFSLLHTANDPSQAMADPEFGQKLDEFARNIKQTMCQA